MISADTHRLRCNWGGGIGPQVCNIGSMLRCDRKHYIGARLSCDDIRSPDIFIMSDKGGMFIRGVFHM